MISKIHKYTGAINFSLRSVLCACCAIIFCTVNASEKNTKPVVIYVHGWQNGLDKNFDHEQKYLTDILDAGSFEVFTWEESILFNFSTCCKQVDSVVSQRLTNYLVEKYPHDKLENVILVGHSLGGRMIIKTMSQLADDGKKIRCGIFLGSAISFEDPDIKKAVTASALKCINIFSKNDEVLRDIFGQQNNESALGAYGYPAELDNLKQYRETFSGHSVFDYLNALRKITSSAPIEYKAPRNIDVRYGVPPIKIFSGLKEKSTVIDRVQEWVLIKDKTSTFYIIDPYNRIRAYGREKSLMKDSFNHIKRSLIK